MTEDSNGSGFTRARGSGGGVDEGEMYFRRTVNNFVIRWLRELKWCDEVEGEDEEICPWGSEEGGVGVN